MNYIEIVNDAMQYIEANLHRKLSLNELASRYYISNTHFYRIFRAVANQTVKSYVLERRLSKAANTLRETNCKVVDIAYQYGFNSHELFTRNFHKKFKTSPSQYRKMDIPILLIKKAKIIERDFINENKDIIVDYSFQELEGLKLLGKEIVFHPENSAELDEATFDLFGFTDKHIIKGHAERMFNIIHKDSNDSSRITSFYGIASEDYSGYLSGLEERTVPKSRYAVFRYPRLLWLVFDTVKKDLKKWLNVTGLQLNKNAGIDM